MFEDYNGNSKMTNILKTAKIGASHNSIFFSAQRKCVSSCFDVIISRMHLSTFHDNSDSCSNEGYRPSKKYVK